MPINKTKYKMTLGLGFRLPQNVDLGFDKLYRGITLTLLAAKVYYALFSMISNPTLGKFPGKIKTAFD